MRIARLVMFAGSLLTSLPTMAADMDWSKVDQVLGKSAAQLTRCSRSKLEAVPSALLFASGPS